MTTRTKLQHIPCKFERHFTDRVPAPFGVGNCDMSGFECAFDEDESLLPGIENQTQRGIRRLVRRLRRRGIQRGLEGEIKETVMTTETKDFKKGDKVFYIPNHADGDINHKDCQNGVVSSTNEKFVFVKYDNTMCTMTTGDEPYTAQATKRENLIRRI